MFCTKCGSELQNEWKVCPVCGKMAVMQKNENTNLDSELKSEAENSKQREIKMEINAGELTLSGQRRFTSEVNIQGDEVIIKNYSNTKKYSTPVIMDFSVCDIGQIKYKSHMTFRKIHKTRFVIAGIIFTLGLFSGFLYLAIAGVFIAGLNCFDSLGRVMEIMLKDGRKIYIHYSDKDDAVQLENELCN